MPILWSDAYMGSGGEVTVELSRVFRSIERGSTMVFGLPYGLVVLCYRRRLLFHIERLCACRTADGCVCALLVASYETKLCATRASRKHCFWRAVSTFNENRRCLGTEPALCTLFQCSCCVFCGADSGLGVARGVVAFIHRACRGCVKRCPMRTKSVSACFVVAWSVVSVGG